MQPGIRKPAAQLIGIVVIFSSDLAVARDVPDPSSSPESRSIFPTRGFLRYLLKTKTKVITFEVLADSSISFQEERVQHPNIQR